MTTTPTLADQFWTRAHQSHNVPVKACPVCKAQATVAKPGRYGQGPGSGPLRTVVSRNPTEAYTYEKLDCGHTILTTDTFTRYPARRRCWLCRRDELEAQA